MKLVYTWVAITLLVVESTAGDILITRAMKQIGDLQELRARAGLLRVIARVLGNRIFLLGISCMTLPSSACCWRCPGPTLAWWDQLRLRLLFLPTPWRHASF